jgi:small subunit ribosomal protein S15
VSGLRDLLTPDTCYLTPQTDFPCQIHPFPKHGTINHLEDEMPLKPEAKTAIMAEFKLHESDTGSPEVQVAMLTNRIKDITEHLKVHSKDFSTRRGLLKLIGQRRRLLDYLKRKDINRYRNLIKALGIRK